MRKFGLIGYPLTHSFSKKYFEEKFAREKISGCSYSLFPIPSIKELPQLLSNEGLSGLNVTIPYKEQILPYLDELDETAQQVTAVNCIKNTNGKWKGYNTDVIGFEISLKELLAGTKPQAAFVLGTGGAAKAVCYVLEKLSIPYNVVSRQPMGDSLGYEDISQHMQAANLFINTTPLGTFPETEAAPDIPYNKLSVNDMLFDLVYNPAQTLFMRKGLEQGAHTKNGLQMLQLQAEESWGIWNS